MIVQPNQYSPLIAMRKNGEIVKIPNHVLRKPMEAQLQTRKLHKNSILITCNYIFNEKKFKWSKHIKGICHPFRNTGVFPDHIPKHLFSESDFCDKITTHVESVSKFPKWDFIYFTIDSLQGIHCKGLYMISMIDKAAKQLGLKWLIVNYGPPRSPIDGNDPESELLSRVRTFLSKTKVPIINKVLDQKQMCRLVQSSRFVLFPNNRDASPRMIPETIIRDVPVVVNQGIYGGWKYVNPSTGVFFQAPTSSEVLASNWMKREGLYLSNLTNAMTHVLNGKFQCSQKFYETFGFRNSCAKLAKIINDISGEDYMYVCYKEWKSLLQRLIDDT